MALTLNKEQKKKLRGILGGMSKGDEGATLEKLDVEKVGEILDFIGEVQEEHGTALDAKYKKMEESFEMILRSFNTHQKVSASHSGKVLEAMTAFTTALSGKLDQLSDTDKGWNKNAAPLFRQVIQTISGMTDKVAEGVAVQANWKFPQYSSVSMRNKNFANVNPAISPFGIEDYDQVFLSYTGANLTRVDYYLSGVKMATLDLVYSGSTLTSVTRSS